MLPNHIYVYNKTPREINDFKNLLISIDQSKLTFRDVTIKINQIKDFEILQKLTFLTERIELHFNKIKEDSYFNNIRYEKSITESLTLSCEKINGRIIKILQNIFPNIKNLRILQQFENESFEMNQDIIFPHLQYLSFPIPLSIKSLMINLKTIQYLDCRPRELLQATNYQIISPA